MSTGIAPQGIRFLASGAVNTILSYLLYLLLLRWLDYLPAYTLAYAAGIALAYALNLRFVFKAQHSWRKLVIFPLIYATQYCLGASVLHLAVSRISVPREFALLVSIAATVPVTFLLSRGLFHATNAAK